MVEHRISDNKTFRFEDEPDDGDFHDLMTDPEPVVLPPKHTLAGFKKTIVNDAVSDMK